MSLSAFASSSLTIMWFISSNQPVEGAVVLDSGHGHAAASMSPIVCLVPGPGGQILMSAGPDQFSSTIIQTVPPLV